MTRALLAVALSALTALPAPAALAAAGPGKPVDRCEFTSMTTPFAPGRQVGYLGGAVVPVADGADLRTGRVTCTVREGWTHTGQAVAAVSSMTTPAVAAAPYAPIEYVASMEDVYTACLSVEIDGAGTFRWDDDAEAWSADPVVLCFAWRDDDGSDVLDDVDELVIEHVDPPLCAVLGGDVAVWDCPPYGGR